MFVESQRVGERPGIDDVVLDARRCLAFAVACGGLGRERKERDTDFEQSLDGRTRGRPVGVFTKAMLDFWP
jgi:hypothetical protein